MCMHCCAFLSDESLLTWLIENANRLFKVFTVFKLIYMHTVFAQHLDFRWQNINTQLCNTCCRYFQYVGIALHFTLSLFFITIYSLFFIVLFFICIMYHRDRTIQLFCGCAIQVAKHFKRRIVYSVNMMIWQKFNA